MVRKIPIKNVPKEMLKKFDSVHVTVAGNNIWLEFEKYWSGNYSIVHLRKIKNTEPTKEEIYSFWNKVKDYKDA